MQRRLALILGLVLATLGADPARAQSAFGCDNLARPGGLPVVEGRGGVFYRVHPDLHNFFPLSDETVARLGELSDVLAAAGTRLIYLPVPTKSLAMPAALSPETADFGFDPDLATTVYDDIVQRLERRGVATADVRKPMVAAQGSAPPYFQADHRWTPDGARIAAAAVAVRLAGVADAPARGGPIAVGPRVEVTLESSMFARIQQHCQSTVPPVRALGFAAPQPGAAPLFTEARPPVVVVGTEYIGESASNFAGFLAAATGLPVGFYGVPDGGAFAAISSFLTSDAFFSARPAVLVWEVPVEANPAQFGDQPLRELIALAGTACRVPLNVFATDIPNRISIDLGALDPGLAHTLFVDADGAASPEAVFTFRSRAGLTRSRSILRHPGQRLSGRFAVPLSGLWPEGAASVEIELTKDFGPAPRALACFYEGQG